MPETREISTKNKALQINLDLSTYGTIAEIGGGQEVARAFFQAGGASGTIAKSISAYDKTFSDNLYNKGKKERYVSEKRLFQMLHKEFEELMLNLETVTTDDKKKFFVFADTVETLNFSKTNKGHGWLGVKFQLKEGCEPNTVMLHVDLHENDGILQQYTLGILGVNLIYACFNFSERPNQFLLSLMDNLNRDRVEINMVRMEGPELNYVDNRLLSVQLVKNNMTNATVFDRFGNVCRPGDFLYKKNALVLRGSFRPITYVGFDMLKSSYGYFKHDEDFKTENTIQLCEITLNNLLEEGDFDERDFLARVDLLNGMGQNVMISNFREFYKLSDYLTEIPIQKIRIIMGANILEKMMNQDWYRNLKGGVLQAMGSVFAENVQLYIYPFKDGKTLYTSSNIIVSESLMPLYQYLLMTGKIQDLTSFKKGISHFSSKDVLLKIHNKDSTWTDMVPKYISRVIIENKLFGYSE